MQDVAVGFFFFFFFLSIDGVKLGFVCYCVGVIIIIFVHVFDMLVSYVNVILFLHARCGYFASTLLAYESALETRDLRLELQE